MAFQFIYTLTHSVRTLLNFMQIAGWENQKSRKLMFVLLNPKPRKFEIKWRNEKKLVIASLFTLLHVTYWDVYPGTCVYVFI